MPLQALPISVTTINNATLRDIGAQRVTDALRLDAAVSDSYNLPAYWDKLSVRGFALDNRHNYRREGLPSGTRRNGEEVICGAGSGQGDAGPGKRRAGGGEIGRLIKTGEDMPGVGEIHFPAA